MKHIVVEYFRQGAPVQRPSAVGWAGCNLRSNKDYALRDSFYVEGRNNRKQARRICMSQEIGAVETITVEGLTGTLQLPLINIFSGKSFSDRVTLKEVKGRAVFGGSEFQARQIVKTRFYKMSFFS